MNARKSVLLVTDSDAFAGTERHIYQLASAFQRDAAAEGFSPAVASPVGSPLERHCRDAGIRTLVINKRRGVDLPAILALRKAASEFDIIHVHNGRTSLLGALALAGNTRCVLINSQHFLSPCRVRRRGLRARLAGRMHRWIAQRCGATIAVSSEAGRLALEREDQSASKLHVVPNGIDPPPMPSYDDVVQMREGLGVRFDQMLIVCAARLQREKNIDDLIDAMKLVAAEETDSVCVIAGEGDCEKALRDQINALGLERRVRLAGFVHELPTLMQAGDVFVLPSRAEPFGLVLLEAMALRRPIIACRSGGPKEILVDGVSGLLVEPGNPPEMAGALLSLIRDSHRRLVLGDAAYDRYASEYRADRMAAATADVYRHAIAQRDRRSSSVSHDPRAVPGAVAP